MYVLGGKLSERNDRHVTQFFADPADFYNVVGDSQNEIQHCRPVSDTVVQVSWKKGEEARESLPHYSPAVAAFVTSQARLRLLKDMNKLPPLSVMYTDTDAIIMRLPKGKRPADYFTIGGSLGEYTDEIVKDYGVGARILEYVATASKSYGLRIRRPPPAAEGGGEGEIVEMVKAKGFTLNQAGAAKVNFRTMKGMVFRYARDRTVIQETVCQPSIRNQNLQLFTVEARKTYNVVCNKGVCGKDFLIKPFGY